MVSDMQIGQFVHLKVPDPMAPSSSISISEIDYDKKEGNHCLSCVEREGTAILSKMVGRAKPLIL